MTPLGNEQFYNLIYYLEKYHNQYQTPMHLQYTLIKNLGAVMYKQWTHPMVIFKGIKNTHNLIIRYDKVEISSDEYDGENLINNDSYFNISLHFDLPPRDDLIRLQQLINVGFGIVLPWINDNYMI